LELLEKEDIEDDNTADRLPSVPLEEPEQTRLSKGEELFYYSMMHYSA